MMEQEEQEEEDLSSVPGCLTALHKENERHRNKLREIEEKLSCLSGAGSASGQVALHPSEARIVLNVRGRCAIVVFCFFRSLLS